MARLDLQVRQGTGLVMSAGLQQAISLLALSNQELLSELTVLAEANPLLVVSPPDETSSALPEETQNRDSDLPPDFEVEDNTYWEDDPLVPGFDPETAYDPPSAEPSLEMLLLAQIRLAFPVGPERDIAITLLSGLDDAGRLQESTEALCDRCGTTPDHLEDIRQRLMLLDPVGCFARTLEECLAAQFRIRGRYDPCVATLLTHLDWLARGEHDRLRRVCALDSTDYADLIAELRSCDPKPGARFPSEPDFLIPDLLLHERHGIFHVELNPRSWPRLQIDTDLYRRLLAATDTDRAYARDKQAEASHLLRAVEQRARSILLIGRALISCQDAFLREGASALRPLTLRDIAARTGLHESTVSRVTATRFIGTMEGIIPLRRFFSAALGEDGNATSADAIQTRIRQIVATETADAILSDDIITRRLQAQGVVIQRRTVAKYREALGIAGSAQRRREKKLDSARQDVPVRIGIRAQQQP